MKRERERRDREKEGRREERRKEGKKVAASPARQKGKSSHVCLQTVCLSCSMSVLVCLLSGKATQPHAKGVGREVKWNAKMKKIAKPKSCGR